MLNTTDILETIKMSTEEHLDIRTITMGISLSDCASEDLGRCCDRIYDKITRRAERLVTVGEALEKEYGIPIINKRVSVSPISLVGAACGAGNFADLARTMDRAADTVGVNFIGGYSALVHKGITPSDLRLMDSLPEALSTTRRVCASVNVATTRSGINMDAVERLGRILRDTAYASRDSGSFGCAKLVVFANIPEDNPFMAGAYHGIGEAECAINVGVSGPGVVRAAIRRHPGCGLTELADVIKKTAFKITRVGQLIAARSSEELGAEFGIVDLSLAPTPAVGDSVAQILEEMGLETCGCHGTTACLAMLNDAVKKGGVMASSHVGGLSGAFIPVSEDAGMVAAAEKGTLCIDKLEAMTAVCSVGLDMIAVPGDTDPDILSAIIADEISIGVVNCKTTAVRLIPAWGCKAGDRVVFGGLWGEAPVMPVHPESPALFIHRGGRIPAPLHAQRN